MARYDSENLLKDIRTLIANNINTAIAAVEAEKIAQGLPATNLAAIDLTVAANQLSGYRGLFEQSWAFANMNISPAIFYGIEEDQTVGVGPATSEAVKVFIEVILSDSGNDTLGVKRVMRYTRAIKDVFESNYDKLPISSGKIKIETMRPISFKLDSDSSEEIRVGGVSIIMAIA